MDNQVGSMAGPGDLAWLAAISQDFAGSPALDATLANAVQQSMVYMNAEAASIFLLDPAGEYLCCRASAGPVSIDGLTLGRGEGIIGRALSSGIVQMVRNVADDADFSKAVDDRTGFVTRSILCAPLSVKALKLGALEVINTRRGDGLFNADDSRFLQVLAGLVSLAVHNAQMTAALVEQERLRRELDLAREIQRSLLPVSSGPAFPVQGLNLPAYEVSGDFYDFFVLPDGRIVWGVGDVSGKGMNAALLMAKTISLFRCLGKTWHDPATLLARLNDEIAETASRGMFVTMVAGVFDPARGMLALANAGHLPPLFRTRAGEYREFEASSPPLGILPGIAPENAQLLLEGGRLYVYTDGLTEGWDAGGDMLGLAGFQALLDRHALQSPDAQMAAVTAVLCRPGTRLRDDLTLLVIG